MKRIALSITKTSTWVVIIGNNYDWVIKVTKVRRRLKKSFPRVIKTFAQKLKLSALIEAKQQPRKSYHVPFDSLISSKGFGEWKGCWAINANPENSPVPNYTIVAKARLVKKCQFEPTTMAQATAKRIGKFSMCCAGIRKRFVRSNSSSYPSITPPSSPFMASNPTKIPFLCPIRIVKFLLEIPNRRFPYQLAKFVYIDFNSTRRKS